MRLLGRFNILWSYFVVLSCEISISFYLLGNEPENEKEYDFL